MAKIFSTLVYAPRNEFEDINSKDDYIHESFLFKYILSFLAASCAEFVTYPLDLAKTRLQLQGEKALQNFDQSVKIGKQRGLVKIGLGIVKEEGFFNLWKGVTPAIYRHLVYSGGRMSIYEFFRKDIFKKNKNDSITLWKTVLSGAVAGGIAQFLASPTDLIKVQIQMEGQRKLQGFKPRVEGFRDAFLKIIRVNGFKGLWKGWAPNVQRAVFVNLGDLATYDIVKQSILKHTPLKDNTLTYALSSACSGLVAATLGTPADVIKARIMNQPTDSKGRMLLYQNSFDCLRQSIKNEGFFSLYKGFFPCWLRMGPWSLTFWLTYEELRKLFGVESF